MINSTIEHTEINTTFNHLQDWLYWILNTQGAKTRPQLQLITNRARTTVYDNLLKMYKRNEVEKYNRNEGKLGRPMTVWRLKL